VRGRCRAWPNRKQRRRVLPPPTSVTSAQPVAPGNAQRARTGRRRDEGLVESVKVGETIEATNDDGSIRVRRVDGKVETRVALKGAVASPKALKVGARAGRVETEVGSVTASIATQAQPDAVLAELVAADGVGVGVDTPELSVVTTPDAPAAPAVAGGTPRRVAGRRGVARRVRAQRRVGRVKPARAEYDGLFGPGSGLSLDVTSTGVKETITLGDRPADDELLTYRSKVTMAGVTARPGKTGGVEFVDADGVVAFTAPQGVMWDSSSSDPAKARKAAVTVSLDGGVLVSTPDAGWLADPLTVFPVFVDPTITVGAAQLMYVEQNNPNTSFQTGPTFLNNFQGSPAFANGGYQGNVARTYERLDTSQFAGSGAEINQAILNTSLAYCEPFYGAAVRFSKVTSGWGALQGNLINNASFETPGANPQIAAGWALRTGNGSAVRTPNASQGLGSVGMQLTASGGGVGWMAIGSQPFPVAGGEPLYVQTDLRLSSPVYWANIRVEYYTAEPAAGWDQMTDSVMATYVDPIRTGVNGTASASVTVPAGMKWGRLSIHTTAPAMDVDNVRVIRNGNGLIANDSFNQGTLGWAARPGTPFGAEQQSFNGYMHNVGTITSATTQVHYNAIATGPFRVIPGEQLTVRSTFWGTGGSFVERIEYYTATPPGGWDAYPATTPPHFTYQDLKDNSTPLPNSPTELTTNPVVPAGAVWARLSLHHTGNNTKIWFDEANVSRASQDPNSYQPTWNTQPPVDTSVGSARQSNTGYQNTPFGVDITDWVRGWVASPASNFGIRLDMDGTGQRCSFTGGYVAIVYNEVAFAPTVPPAGNTVVNGGFESGVYQWAPCVDPNNVKIDAVYNPAGARSGVRYGKMVPSATTGFACQRSGYGRSGQGDDRITYEAWVKTDTAGQVPVNMIIDQQGNPAQGAQYQSGGANALLTGTWQKLSATMCEQSSANQVLSVYFATSTAGASVLIDDVTLTVTRDSRPFASGGCTGVPPLLGGGGGTTPPTPPTLSLLPEGLHYFEANVETPLQLAANPNLCVGLNPVGVAVLLSDALSATNGCEVVVPRPVGGDGQVLSASGDGLVVGWVLERKSNSSQCLGRTASQAFGVIGCRSLSGFRTLDNAITFDSPGRVGFAFPMRLSDTGGNPNDLCVTPQVVLAGSAITYQACSPQGQVGPTQLWFDALSKTTPPTTTPTNSASPVPNDFAFSPNIYQFVFDRKTVIGVVSSLSYQAGRAAAFNPLLVLTRTLQEGTSPNDWGAARNAQIHCELVRLGILGDPRSDEFCDSYGITNLRKEAIESVYNSTDPVIHQMVLNSGVNSSKQLIQAVILDPAAAIGTAAAYLRSLNLGLRPSFTGVTRTDGVPLSRADVILLEGSDGNVYSYANDPAQSTALLASLDAARNKTYLTTFRARYLQARGLLLL
jgi:hypothetical protein